MKCFKITKNQINFILKYCSNLLPSLSIEQAKNYSDFVIKLTPAQQMQLVDYLTDLFISIGLDDNSEPNNVGLQIETLIDIFNFYKDYTIFSFTKDEWQLILKCTLNSILPDGSILDLRLNIIKEKDQVILLLNNQEHKMLLISLYELLIQNEKFNKTINKIRNIINKL